MAFSIIQHQISSAVGTSDAAGNTGNLVWASTPVNGNLMCVAITFRGNATVTGPAGWTRVGTGIANGTTAQTEIWYRVASGETTTGPAFVIAASVNYLLAQVEVSGWTGTPTLDTSGTGTATAAATVSVQAGVTAAASEFVFACCGNAEGNTASVVFNASTSSAGLSTGPTDVDTFNPAKNNEGIRDTWGTSGALGVNPQISFNTSSSSNTRLAAISAAFRDVAAAAAVQPQVVAAAFSEGA